MNKYWQGHAEQEALQLSTWPPHHTYGHVICIPAYNESPDCLYQLSEIASHYSQQLLLILVINQPVSETDIKVNQPLLSALHKNKMLWQCSNLMLYRIDKNGLDVLCVDRYSPSQRIPDKQGVGLARKIACDIAARLIEAQCIQDDKIFSSDADVIFPLDYFNVTLPPQASAGTFPFQHIYNDNKAVHDATLAYESSLHHYVDGLKNAGSPYAYHTMGSCLVIKATHYIQTRGFPKRTGAEDFYLLNKLNKLLPVVALNQPTLLIKSRQSQRVPFGTGPSTAQLLTGKKNLNDFFYPDDCFVFLSIWLHYLDYLCRHYPDSTLEDFINLHDPDLTPKTQQRLQTMQSRFKLDEVIKKISTNYQQLTQRQKAIHDWFDGFKSLKMIRMIKLDITSHPSSLTEASP